VAELWAHPYLDNVPAIPTRLRASHQPPNPKPRIVSATQGLSTSRKGSHLIGVKVATTARTCSNSSSSIRASDVWVPSHSDLRLGIPGELFNLATLNHHHKYVMRMHFRAVSILPVPSNVLLQVSQRSNGLMMIR
jgi:hypothetical protein